MTYADILRLRLRNQRLTTRFKHPTQVVEWLGAVQAQDYPAAKWAVAERTARATNAAIDRLFAEGAILRTHVLRPTWHFVLPHDIRWMLELTGPRVNRMCASYYRRMKVDETTAARSQKALERALRGGRSLTRSEMSAALREAGVTSARDDKFRLMFILLRAELDGVICSGPLREKQFTYALLDERAPRHGAGHVADGGSELAARYFRSHGPATLKDFMWWSSLTARDARAAVDSIRTTLVSTQVDGRTYWSARRAPRAGRDAADAHLLPTYDECLVAYRDRLPFSARQARQIRRDRGQMVVVGRRFAGTWRRRVTRKGLALEVTSFDPLNARERDAVAAAAARFESFVGLPLTFHQR